jgi:CheY-like chemotaxis protein
MSGNDDPSRSHGCDGGDLGGVRVLLVEDDLDSRLVVALLLEWHGAEVLATGALDEALAAYGGFVPDVVVTDVDLEVGSGLDLVEDLRRRGDLTPAVAMSGDCIQQEALARGCQAFLSKPIASRALADVIRSVLTTTRSA